MARRKNKTGGYVTDIDTFASFSQNSVSSSSIPAVETRRSATPVALQGWRDGDVSDLEEAEDSSSEAGGPTMYNVAWKYTDSGDTGATVYFQKEYAAGSTYGDFQYDIGYEMVKNGPPTRSSGNEIFVGWNPDALYGETGATLDKDAEFWAGWTAWSGWTGATGMTGPTLSCSVTFSFTEPSGEVRTQGTFSFAKDTPYYEILGDTGVAAALDSIPSRSAGYWNFIGWSEDFGRSGATGTPGGGWTGDTGWEGFNKLSSDIVSWAGYTAARVSFEIDANGATGYTAGQLLEGVWGEMYPDLPTAPEKNGERSAGTFLTTVANRAVLRTHDSSGAGIAKIESRELGAGTRGIDDADAAFPMPCTLVVHWSEPLTWNTQDDLRNAIGVIPTPFASDPSATVMIADYDDSSDTTEDVSFKGGFPETYTKPLIDPTTGEVNKDARVITRRQVNTLGYIGTQEQFFEQCGGYHTFDQGICDAIGGYPETSILRFYDADTNSLRTVYSLVDNNTWNFIENGVDGIHWKYIDNNPVLSLKVDYSDFIDLRDILFVETGQPDFYEVPFDGFLQLHALSCCDLRSILRNTVDPDYQYAVERVDATQHSETISGAGGEQTQVWVLDPIYEKCQGDLETKLRGSVYLDIYNAKTNTTNSIQIRYDTSTGFGASSFVASPWGVQGLYYMYKEPCYVVTQGAFFLNKGDKIRVRGTYTDRKRTAIYDSTTVGDNSYVRYTDGTLGDATRVNDIVLTDKDIRRIYLSKFANLYRVGWEA